MAELLVAIMQQVNGSRRVSLGGITRHPDSSWMAQAARNVTMQDTGYLKGCRYSTLRATLSATM